MKPTRTRAEMIRDFYLNDNRIDAKGPRAQTGPKASFMGKAAQMKQEEETKTKKDKNENKRSD